MIPPFVTRALVAERLKMIFPEGTPARGYCVRELAASTVFTALYIGAVEGSGQFMGPAHVYRMTQEQAAKTELSEREAYADGVLKRAVPGSRWYADNTREPIRDETLRDGLIPVGAVIRREDLPTTSSRPRYALTPDFASLFDPVLKGKPLDEAIAAFQAARLSAGALARIAIMRAGATAGAFGVMVTFPSGETRRLAPGPSSIIAKAAIETFAPRFLERAAVLWLSESGAHVVVRDQAIAASIGLEIEADKNLPDLVFADLGPAEPLIVFVELVASDGAVTTRRRDALLAIADRAGFSRSRVAFVTAFLDRRAAGFRKTVAELAWGSYAWFASEPGQIIALYDGAASGARLGDLIKAAV